MIFGNMQSLHFFMKKLLMMNFNTMTYYLTQLLILQDKIHYMVYSQKS